MNTEHHPGIIMSKAPSRAHKILKSVWLTIAYFFDVLADAIIERFALMQTEIDLFLGAALALFGTFSFQAGKYCDGNTADYLSCTRPATYYYYSPFSIVAVVIGVCLILVWFVRNKRR